MYKSFDFCSNDIENLTVVQSFDDIRQSPSNSKAIISLNFSQLYDEIQTEFQNLDEQRFVENLRQNDPITTPITSQLAENLRQQHTIIDEVHRYTENNGNLNTMLPSSILESEPNTPEFLELLSPSHEALLTRVDEHNKKWYSGLIVPIEAYDNDVIRQYEFLTKSF